MADAPTVVVCDTVGCSDDAQPVGGPWLEDVTDQSHTYTLLHASPEVTVRLTDPAGVASETAHEPTWRRVGGTEQCGGPQEAELELR